MDYKLLNIEKTLERSRKVLMDSMEVSAVKNITPLKDRTSEKLNITPKTPVINQSYLEKLSYLAELESQENQRKLEIEKLEANNSANRKNILQNKQKLIESLKLRIENSDVNIENEILKKKIQELKSNDSVVKIEGIDSKDIDENRDLKNRKFCGVANDKSKCYDEKQEGPQKKYCDLKEKLDKLIEKNQKISSVLISNDPQSRSLEKYKILTKVLMKKLEKVTKKYKILKEKTSSKIIRHKSASRREDYKKVSRQRTGSSKRNITPARKQS